MILFKTFTRVSQEVGTWGKNREHTCFSIFIWCSNIYSAVTSLTSGILVVFFSVVFTHTLAQKCSNNVMKEGEKSSNTIFFFFQTLY